MYFSFNIVFLNNYFHYKREKFLCRVLGKYLKEEKENKYQIAYNRANDSWIISQKHLYVLLCKIGVISYIHVNIF